MAFITVTNTFVNGATADAPSVNQNFTDILNGLSDTTKDFSMNNGTLASTLTCNGNVVIGSSSSKTVNFLGSLISSVPVSANNSWDLGGSGLGFKSIYLGSAGGFTTRVLGGATSNWSLTLPTTAGVNLQVLTTDGVSVSTWQTAYNDPTARQNYGISSTVSASALTINLLGANGSNPSATNPVNINFRSATAATGTPSFIQCMAATSLTVPSGATLGTTSAVASYLYLYAVNNAGTIELAVAGNNGVIDEGSIQNTTNLTSGSSSGQIPYGTNGRSGVAIRLLGRLKVTEATAGTWASAPSEISAGTHFPPTVFFVSSLISTTSSNIATGVLTTFSNSPALTFTPAITGTYKVYCYIPFYVDAGTTVGIAQISNTTGSATLLEQSQITAFGTGAVLATMPAMSVYTLTSGTSYVFDIQAVRNSGSGNVLNRGDLANFYMFAEFVGVR